MDLEISHRGPKEVLRADGFQEYEDGMDFFYSELVQLNTIIYLAEKIIDDHETCYRSEGRFIYFESIQESCHRSDQNRI